VARLDPFDRPGVARGGSSEPAVYADRARRLGLKFVPFMRLGSGARADVEAIRRGAFAVSVEGERLAYLAPDEDAMRGVLHWLGRYPSARRRLRVSTPSAIRAALLAAGEERLAKRTVSHLAKWRPDLSAERVATGGQIAAAVVLLILAAAAFMLRPQAAFIVLNLIGGALFFGVSVLRFVAAGFTRAPHRAASAPEFMRDGNLPIYTVLVPLVDEAAIIDELIDGLEEIDWPRDRLDVKLILEAGDQATIGAVRKRAGRAPYQIIIVPPIGPRTKPKALSFALAFARGEFVTVYDAEDRPHPWQIREAHAAFSREGRDLACLQSALVIDNGSANWLARLFTVEYAALFDGLLPALAKLGFPLPLGGTSNHFRRAALEAVGGWDPYNVTEDADMGIRLARFGYRAATIGLPTLEGAPATLGPWLRQRTRWFKGWMQTWLVHTRRPVRLTRELGPRGLLGFNLVATGLIVSSLVYPIYLATILAFASNPFGLWGDGDIFAAMVLGVDLFNLVAGYVAMALLGCCSLDVRGRASEARGMALLPVYWLLMSVAAYRAVFELFVRPHHWEKTPHPRRRSSRRADP
jgi:cellulose synthase/poly-beta-1,6-N-acetylglucosamine synthase-like glycosyltransferase